MILLILGFWSLRGEPARDRTDVDCEDSPWRTVGQGQLGREQKAERGGSEDQELRFLSESFQMAP
jgi:hypothetical protein